jgi:hypothetical protein
MWANADDQGRLTGEVEEVKYAVCPNIDHITKADIPELLEELDKNELIKLYNTSKTEAIQILDWWEVHRPQWAWPSQYPPPEGWQDHLRYKKSAKEVVTLNWFSQVSTQVSDNTLSGERSGETSEVFPLTTPLPEPEKENERGKRRGRGNSPESSGEKPSPSPTGLSTELEILHRLSSCFKKEWGRVPAESPYEIIPREPNAKESAQLRDLAKELSSAGGCPLDYIDQAFKEAAGQPKEKMRVSYVRAILLDWLGVPRGPP